MLVGVRAGGYFCALDLERRPVSDKENIASAYVAAFAKIGVAMKDANNPHFKSKYADITSVINTIKPALAEHGLAFIQTPQATTDGVTVLTTLHHASGETMDLGSLFVPVARKDAQGFGSAMTYARRYALLCAFGVPTDDDDGNDAVRGNDRPQQRPSEKVEQKPKPEAMPDDEYDRLASLAKASKTSEASLKKYYKVDDLRHLDQKQYGEAVKGMTEKLAKQAQEQTNAEAGEFSGLSEGDLK